MEREVKGRVLDRGESCKISQFRHNGKIKQWKKKSNLKHEELT